MTRPLDTKAKIWGPLLGLLYLALIAFLMCFLCGCGYRPVNPGAQCEIYPGLTPNGMGLVSEYNGVSLRGGEPRGLWTEVDGGKERIYTRGMIGEGGFTLLHEYQHHLERALENAGDPYGVKVARHAFRELMGGGFEIGQEDLMQEIP